MNIETKVLSPGTLVDNRYEIVRKIGRGGFATVYQARHIQLERPVALKILDPITAGSTDNFIQRFLSEAKIVANLRHPNVVMIYDFGVVQSDQPYIAMDLLEGHDLEAELVNYGPLSPARTKHLFLGVLDALDAGHQKKIVHKDLKPSNLFLVNPRTDKEKLIVLDYGIARIADTESPRLTQTGGYIGTPAYMAPEYIEKSIVAPTNDVYQIGLILVESMTGNPVIVGQSSMACMVAHLGGETHIPSWILESVWAPMLHKSLVIDPQLRYQSAGEFRREFESLPVFQAPNIIEPDFDSDFESGLGLGAISSNIMLKKHVTAKEKPSSGTSYPAVITPPESQMPTSHIPVASVPVSQAQGGITPPYASPEFQHPQPLNPHGREKTSSSLLWGCLLLLIGIPALSLVIALAIYGLYDVEETNPHPISDWTPPSLIAPSDKEEEEKKAKLAMDEEEDILESANPNLKAKVTPSAHNANSVRKIAYFLQAQHIMVMDLKGFEKSLSKYKKASRSTMYIVSKDDALEGEIEGMESAIEIVGSKKLDAKAIALVKEMRELQSVAVDIRHYYKVDESYKKDGGKKGAIFRRRAKTTTQKFREKYNAFDQELTIYYKHVFNACLRKTEERARRQYAACHLLLRAQEVSEASHQDQHLKEKIEDFVLSLKRLRKVFTNDRASMDKAEYQGYVTFETRAESFLQNARKHKKAGNPVFIDMDWRFLLNDYRHHIL